MKIGTGLNWDMYYNCHQWKSIPYFTIVLLMVTYTVYAKKTMDRGKILGVQQILNLNPKTI